MARTKIKTADITAAAITSAEIATDAVTASEIAANAVTTSEILDANVTLAKVADQAANTVLVRDASSSGVVSAKAVATTEILIGDGTGFTAAALSGDTTMTNAGAVTIADNAVSLAKMAGLVRGKLIVGDASGDPSALTVGTADQVLTSDGTDASWADLSGGTSWQSVKTSTVTAVAGEGYPVNTTAGAITVNLPAGSVGDVVEIIDYAGTAGTNNITVSANGSENIQGATLDQSMQGEREGVRLVYVDATQGWIVATTGYVGTTVFEPFSASGGTETTSGSFTIHTYTGSGTFVVGGGTSKSCDIMTLAGGASGGTMGGGGAGGMYEFTTAVDATGGNGSGTYTITVGGGGAGSPSQYGANGTDSIFHAAPNSGTAGGGGGGNNATTNYARPGGCGGGGHAADGVSVGGSGNTPSRSPSQGYSGGIGSGGAGPPGHSGGGGGGAGAIGTSSPGTPAGNGGAGRANDYSGSSVTRGGGGGGGGFVYHGSAPRGTGGSGGGGNGGSVNQGAPVAGGVNQGGGGGAGGYSSSGSAGHVSASGGSGLVIIRYLT